jgi:hypothetical protein
MVTVNRTNRRQLAQHVSALSSQAGWLVGWSVQSLKV